MLSAILLAWALIATFVAVVLGWCLKVYMANGAVITKRALRGVLDDLPPAQRARVEHIIDKQ